MKEGRREGVGAGFPRPERGLPDRNMFSRPECGFLARSVVYPTGVCFLARSMFPRPEYGSSPRVWFPRLEYVSLSGGGSNIAVAILIRTVLLDSMTPTCQLSTVNCQHQQRPNLTGYSYNFTPGKWSFVRRCLLFVVLVCLLQIQYTHYPREKTH